MDVEEAFVSWTLLTQPSSNERPLLLVRDENESEVVLITCRGSTLEVRHNDQVLVSKAIDQHGGVLEAYISSGGPVTELGIWENGRELLSEALDSPAREMVAMGPLVSISH